MRDYTITIEDVLERDTCWDRDYVRDYAQKLGWERASAADLLTLRGQLDDADLIWLLCDPRLWPREVWTRVLDGWVDRAVRVHAPAALDAAAEKHPDMQHRTALREAAQRCRDEGTRQAAADAAQVAWAAAKSAAWSATRASRSAAWAAEDAAGAAGARAAAARVADSAAWAAAARAARVAWAVWAAESADAADAAAEAEWRRQLGDFERAERGEEQGR